jgi:hypothetical protein
MFASSSHPFLVTTLIKKKIKNPHILYKEVQIGSGAKSYMRQGFPILVIYCIRRLLVIYDSETDLV